MGGGGEEQPGHAQGTESGACMGAFGSFGTIGPWAASVLPEGAPIQGCNWLSTVQHIRRLRPRIILLLLNR